MLDQHAFHKETGWFRSAGIFLNAAYVTLRISVLYMIYSFFYKGDVLRQQGNQLLHWWSTHLLKPLRMEYQVIPRRAFIPPNAKRRYIIMSNHRSFYDIPLILLAAGPATIRMITKQELFRIPIWGRALRLSEFIPLDRSNRRAAVQQLRYAKEKLDSGVTLWISPEGTRSKDENLLSFKNGGFKLAKQMDAIIIPIFIDYSAPPCNSKNRFNLGIKTRLYLGNEVDSKNFAEPDRLREAIYAQIKNLAANSLKPVAQILEHEDKNYFTQIS